MKEARATALVTVKLEVRLSAAWGADCTLGQLQKQAEEEAIELISRVLESATKDPTIKREGDVQCLRIVGRPDVQAIVTKESR